MEKIERCADCHKGKLVTIRSSVSMTEDSLHIIKRCVCCKAETLWKYSNNGKDYKHVKTFKLMKAR